MPSRDAKATAAGREAALRDFFERTWKRDVTPLLKDELAQWRAAGARVTGGAAAAAGGAIDRLLGLRGRPFTRALSVMGSTFGAILPDAWLTLVRGSRRVARLVDTRVAQVAAELPEHEALRLFGLSPEATRAELRSVWHATARQVHPDRAADERQRVEYHYRFLVYQAAYERLCAAYDEGRLPQPARA